MSTPKPVQVIHFKRSTAGEPLSCKIEVFEDGVCIVCEDVATIIEFCPDAVERAVKYVESRGYVRCAEKA